MPRFTPTAVTADAMPQPGDVIEFQGGRQVLVLKIGEHDASSALVLPDEGTHRLHTEVRKNWPKVGATIVARTKANATRAERYVAARPSLPGIV
jgi:hypothetical protein